MAMPGFYNGHLAPVWTMGHDGSLWGLLGNVLCSSKEIHKEKVPVWPTLPHPGHCPACPRCLALGCPSCDLSRLTRGGDTGMAEQEGGGTWWLWATELTWPGCSLLPEFFCVSHWQLGYLLLADGSIPSDAHILISVSLFPFGYSLSQDQKWHQ